MFGLKIFVQVQTFWRGPPVPPYNFCHPGIKHNSWKVGFGPPNSELVKREVEKQKSRKVEKYESRDEEKSREARDRWAQPGSRGCWPGAVPDPGASTGFDVQTSQNNVCCLRRAWRCCSIPRCLNFTQKNHDPFQSLDPPQLGPFQTLKVWKILSTITFPRISMLSRSLPIFVRPRYDHCLQLSLTHWLTHFCCRCYCALTGNGANH